MLLYAAFLIRYDAFSASGSDATGYLNAARLLGERRLKIRVTPLDTLHIEDRWRDFFIPLGFVHIHEPRMFAPSYPLGYPAHLLLFASIGGWNHAPYYVTPLAAIICVIVLYKLARLFALSRAMAIAAAATLAVSPAWIYQAVQPMSDVTATMWCAIAMYCAWRAGDPACPDRRDRLSSIACGVAFAMAVWVRPNNLLLAIAIGCAMRFRWRPMVTSAVAALPFGIALMATNRYLYGSAAITGYGRLRDAFTAGACGPHHAIWLAMTLTPLVFPGALLVAFDRREDAWRRATLLAWFLPFFVFYSSYAVCDAWWYLRFLLPAYPPLIIGALVLMRDFTPPRVRAVLIAIVLVTGVSVVQYFRIYDLYHSQRVDMHAVHWAEKQLPRNALVVSMQMSGAYYLYTGRFPVRYDYFIPPLFEEMRAYAGNARTPWYALVFDWEEPELMRRMPGKWTKVNGMYNAVLLRLAPE